MLRNLGIVAHVNAGKTTLSEQILFLTGKQGFLGDVEAGTATMDCQPQEQERGISISAAMSCVQWGDVTVHLIDTPGHVDFGPEIERALQVIDGVVVVLDGVSGVESQTETVWRSLEKNCVPRLVFVNKLDRQFADYQASIDSLHERLAAPTLSLGLPLLDEKRFHEYLSDDSPSHDEARGRIVEVCSDFDPSILADYVDGSPVSAERLLPVLRQATIESGVVPVLGGSALEGWGVKSLLGAVCDFLPGPEDRPRHARDGQLLVSRRTNAVDLVALIFKVVIEPDTVLGFVRIFQGSLRAGDCIESSSGQRFVASELWSMHALDREPLTAAGPGAVLAIPLPPGLRCGQTLHAPGVVVELAGMETAPPVLTMTLEPKASEDRGLLRQRAEELIWQDPSLHLDEDPVTGDLLVSGMGELHLEIFGSQLQAALSQPPRLGQPGIREAERPLGSATAEGVCQRLVGERALVARIELRIEPKAGGGPAELQLGPNLDGLPVERLTILMAALREICTQGLSVGCPIRSARIELLSADFGLDPGQDSVTLARDALRLALQRAMKKAKIETLEPWMRFEVDCPSDSLSQVLAELRSRQAEISEVLPSYGVAKIRGGVSLARVLGWSTSLRSVTKGKGLLQLEFSHFAAKEPHKKA